MRLTRSAVILALGFFALVAQTLLFREFLTAFEGNELGVGSFFGSWLLWVALGAVVGRMYSRRPRELSPRFELLTLLYIPAFLVQQYAIAHARQVGGVSAYEIYPFAQMFAASLLVNAPVSLMTGFLFTLACQWSAREHALPVARVYILETFGSFTGGIVVTFLLARGVAAETVFLGTSFMLTLAGAVSLFFRPTAERSSGKPDGIMDPDAGDLRSGVPAESGDPRRALGLPLEATNQVSGGTGDTRRASGAGDLPRALVDRPARGRSFACWLLPVALLAVIPVLVLSGLAGRWSEWNTRAIWGKLLPPEAYQSRFTTAQARYLYGEREGQFLVMSWGGVSESLPNVEHASEIVALSLAQHPTARRVLVVGPGSLPVCSRLMELPQVQRVVWLHPDPDYPRMLLDVLPERFQAAAERVEIPGIDVRQFIGQSPRQFDLVVLNLPDATTLVLNRYWTLEFFALLSTTLADGGVVCTKMSGGANYLGDELLYLGASAVHTIESVFERVVLKPGDESWLIASDSQALSAAPAVLRDRFAAIEGAAAVYPPDGLMSLYVPDRAEFQLNKYREAAAANDEEMLLNTDRRPKALLFSMLLTLRRAQFLSLADHLPVLLIGGVWIAVCPILLYALLRLVYLLAPRSRRVATAPPPPQFDGQFLIFSTGLAGMSLSIVLMFLYQSHFGSLFLHIGLISSLFMLGSCLGSVLAERLLVRQASEPRYLLPGCVLAHLVLVLLTFLLPAGAARSSYAVLFAGSGFFVGIYFPIAAHRMRVAGRDPGASGSNLEMLDHVGGTAGAVLTGWMLLPALGGELTLGILALLVAVNLIPLLVRARPVEVPRGADWFDRLARPVGYTMVGVGALAVITSNIVAAVQSGQGGRLLLDAARAMTGSAELAEQQTQLEDGTVLTYFTTADSSEGEGGFVFSTTRLTHGVSGYGGPIVLAAYVDREGTLRDLRIIRSNETPAYVESLQGWLQQLPGKNVFHTSPFEEVDAVSGATMTTEAVLQTLEQSGHGFAAAVLGIRTANRVRPSRSWIPDREFVCLATLLALAVALRRRPGTWRRRVFLVVSLALTGVFLNLQYSTQQVVALLSLQLPSAGLSGSFLLVLAVPLLVLFFGNVYCGYVCPFGAMQELVGDLRPAKLATDPDKRVWRYGRAVKYALLLLLLVLYALARDYSVLSADPLITVFSTLRDRPVLAMGVLILGLSFVFRRFWCRNLCPAGAFLALLCGIKLLPKLMPPTGPARCDLGVRAASELDCLCCDRCKHEED